MVASAHADIYFMPPSPERVVLQSGRAIVAVNASALQVYPANRAFFQLAVVAKPSPVPLLPPGSPHLIKFGVEDPTPMPIRPISAVSNDDLRFARALLERSGIAPKLITTRLTATANAVGQVLVAIDPPTAASSALLQGKIESVTAEYPQILPAGTIVMRTACDAEKRVEAIATTQAQTTAAILADAAGLARGSLVSNRPWHADEDNYGLQVTCRGGLPTLPASVAYLAELRARAYPVSVDRAMTFALREATHASRVHPARSSGTAFVENRLVWQQVIVPDDEPFVSAQGQASVHVVPAGFVAVFHEAPTPQQHHAAPFQELLAALRSAGIKPANILQTGDAIYAKVRSQAALAPVWKRTAKPPLSGTFELAIDPFVSNCRAIRAQVTAAAFARAKTRALTMASEAHARVSDVLAIVDAGQTVGALCGYDAATPVQRLARAAQALDPVWPPGSGATFASAMVVAWRLHLKPVQRARSWPKLALAYAFSSTIDEAFTTRGDGVMGDARERRSGCGEAHLDVLAAASREAVARSRPRVLQALLDQGETTGMSSGVCTQRVLAVVAR